MVRQLQNTGKRPSGTQRSVDAAALQPGSWHYDEREVYVETAAVYRRQLKRHRGTNKIVITGADVGESSINRQLMIVLKPNSITLASSELAPNMFEAGSCQIPLH